MSHPIEGEMPGQVVRALLDWVYSDEVETPETPTRVDWEERWQQARRVEHRRKVYDDAWTASLYGVSKGGQ
jgi:hypothetical protein